MNVNAFLEARYHQACMYVAPLMKHESYQVLMITRACIKLFIAVFII